MIEEEAISADGEEDVADPTLKSVPAAIETVVRTRRARAGRLPRHLVSMLPVSDPDPLQSTLRRIRAKDPQLIVAGGECANGESKGRNVTRQLLAQVPCDAISLYGDERRSVKATKMIVGTTEGPHDKAAAEIAASTAAASKAALNTLCIETEVGEQAIEVGERGHALRISLSKGGCRVGR